MLFQCHSVPQDCHEVCEATLFYSPLAVTSLFCRIRRTYSGHYPFSHWLRWQRICLQCRRSGFNPWVRKIPWRMEWLPTPVFLSREFQGQRRLADYSSWGCTESHTTEQLTHTHTHTHTHMPFLKRFS